jgi:hypothetical protein
MEAHVPSQKPDFARIVLGCKGLREVYTKPILDSEAMVSLDSVDLGDRL